MLLLEIDFFGAVFSTDNLKPISGIFSPQKVSDVSPEADGEVSIHMQTRKKGPWLGLFFFWGGMKYGPQLYRDYFIGHYFRFPSLKKTSISWKVSGNPFFFFVAQKCKTPHVFPSPKLGIRESDPGVPGQIPVMGVLDEDFPKGFWRDVLLGWNIFFEGLVVSRL